MSQKRIKRRSREERRAIIADQESSGESVSAYCRRRQISEKSFYGWRKRLGVNAETEREEFIQITSTEASSKKVLNIKTPGGYHLEIPEGMDEAYVKSIMTVLR